MDRTATAQPEPQEGRLLSAEIVKRASRRMGTASRNRLDEYDLVLTYEVADPSIGEEVKRGSR